MAPNIVTMIQAAVITCSNRSASGARPDDSGALLAAGVRAWGYDVVQQVIVADDVVAIQAAVQAAVAAGVRLILTTGGTGLTPGDVTPEAVGALLERRVDGIAEQLRVVGAAAIPTAVLSRGIAGTIGDALVVTLPGSPGGVRDGLAVLTPIVGHALDQLTGGDHRYGGGV